MNFFSQKQEPTSTVGPRLSKLFSSFINEKSWETDLEGGLEVTQFFRNIVSHINNDVPFNQIDKENLYSSWSDISKLISVANEATHSNNSQIRDSARTCEQSLFLIEHELLLSTSYFVSEILQNWEIVGKSNHTYRVLAILAQSYKNEPEYALKRFEDSLAELEVSYETLNGSNN